MRSASIHAGVSLRAWRPCAVVAALVLVVAAGPARAAELPGDERRFVDRVVAEAMREGRIPGVTISITGPKGGYTRAYGVADVSTGSPMRVRDHVRIASITKSFVATAVLQQVDRGRLSLSDTLDRWVKGIPNGDEITVRRLLAMRSGIYDFTADPEFDAAFDGDPLMAFKPRDVIPIVRRHAPLFAPGARTEYADTNYVLLGIILERVTGRSVESLVERGIVRRLGLRGTRFPTTPTLPAPFARGYYAGDDGAGELRDYTAVNPAVPWTAGAMIATVSDLRRWGRALASGKLLSRRLHRAQMRFGAFANPSGPFAGYGLGIMRLGNWVGHNGAIFGYSTVTMRLPRLGAQIVAAANLSSNASTPTTDMFAQIAARLYPRAGGLRAQGS